MSDTSAVRQHAPSKDSSAGTVRRTAAPAGDLEERPSPTRQSLSGVKFPLQGLKITASLSVTVSSSSPAARKPGSGLEQEREEGASGTTRIDTEEQHDTDEEAVLVLNPVNPQIRRLPPTRTIQNLYVFGQWAQLFGSLLR
ncbi:MAG: hypothetical protein R3D66_04475 [Alphaproteobacteria bacterium]